MGSQRRPSHPHAAGDRMNPTTKIPEALAVLDTMARGCALYADHCVGDVERGWRSELEKFDKARAALATEHEALKWFIENDDTNIGQPGNEYWEDGLNQGIEALAAVEVLK
jgi:hypothetical protein